ncbi:MAG: dolichyl-phosphate beta-glucosyltransferase [Brevefilum sp.]
MGRGGRRFKSAHPDSQKNGKADESLPSFTFPFFLLIDRSCSEVRILTKLLLSIIIPAHNEAQRLPPTLRKIDSFLKRQSYAAEVLVVENGSSDATLEVARSFMEQMPNLRVFTEEERGKGLAVKRGMLEAYGEYRFLCDADLSMPIEQVSRFLPAQVKSCDVAIGSREVKGAQRYDEPPYRHLIGRIFNTMVRWVLLPGLQDTQCGFKCFTDEVAETVFPLQTLGGMSFDAEVLYIARKKGYQIREIPIDWVFNPDSRVRLLQDSLRMGFDLLTIRWNDLRGRYDAKS